MMRWANSLKFETGLLLFLFFWDLINYFLISRDWLLLFLIFLDLKITFVFHQNKKCALIFSLIHEIYIFNFWDHDMFIFIFWGIRILRILVSMSQLFHIKGLMHDVCISDRTMKAKHVTNRSSSRQHVLCSTYNSSFISIPK